MKGETEPAINKWESRLIDHKGQSSHQAVDVVDDFKEKYKLPDKMKEYNTLPPSLIPPSIENLVTCNFEDWG